MRPINNNEYRRMRRQTESRFIGQSELGFQINYLKADNSGNATWIEPGYIGNFSLGAGYLAGELWRTQVQKVTATCRVPIRYYQTAGEAFIIKNAPAGFEEALGKPFDFVVRGSNTGSFLVPGVPACQRMAALSLFNLEPTDDDAQELDFELVTRPQIINDQVIFNLEAEYLSNKAMVLGGSDGTIAGGYYAWDMYGNVVTSLNAPRKSYTKNNPLGRTLKR